MLDRESKPFYVGVAFFIAVMAVVIFIIVGPAGISRRVDSWLGDAYGSDWLVVQYSMSGDVINYWELKDKSIGSEEGSDGIYFTDNDENVVHLSGHYVYIQVNDFNSAKEKYIQNTEDSQNIDFDRRNNE
jgi:hypothetical protein